MAYWLIPIDLNATLQEWFPSVEEARKAATAPSLIVDSETVDAVCSYEHSNASFHKLLYGYCVCGECTTCQLKHKFSILHYLYDHAIQIITEEQIKEEVK